MTGFKEKCFHCKKSKEAERFAQGGCCSVHPCRFSESDKVLNKVSFPRRDAENNAKGTRCWTREVLWSLHLELPYDL